MDRKDWPSTINVTHIVSYDVETVYQNLLSDNRAAEGEIEITLEDVISMIEVYAKDDFSCSWGHEANIKDFIFNDEDGNEY